jgi:large subunit ribosomal protein L32
MVGLPKKKVSSARRGQRRSHDRIVVPPLMSCPQCKHRKPTHQVCPNCGTYNGIDVLRLDAKAKQKPE